MIALRKLSSLSLRVRTLYHVLRVALTGNTVLNDRYGLRYHLWSDSRLRSTIAGGVGTDDTGVLAVIFAILEAVRGRRDSITCVDVGAYLGVVSLAMSSRLRATDRVFAFEPSPISFRRLQQNLLLNKNSIITPFPMALSAAVGTAKLRLMADPGTSHITKLSESSVVTGGQDLVDVPIGTLDLLALEHSIDHITLLKVDAEGHDDAVLAGADRLLSSHDIDYIVAEHIVNSSGSMAAIELLRSYGFNCSLIVRNGTRVVQDPADYPDGGYKPALNLLAVSSEAPFTAEQLRLLSG